MSKEKNDFLTRGCSSKPKTHQKNDKLYNPSCCKRNAYDWLSNIHPPKVYKAFPYVEVRFKNSRKDFFINSDNIDIELGDIVAVESSPGHDIGIITLMGEAVRLQMKKKHFKPETREIKKIYRRARPSDIEKWISVVVPEDEILFKTKKITADLELVMKVNDVEFQGDGTKATFYYTAEDRVDFRELIKVLAEKFSVRVEMRQIGVRQEASSLGGIGTCGRELCCSSWMFDFKSVSTNTARVQQLTINPQKLAGQCSKLKCCLNYEYECYLDMLKDFPNTDILLKTKKGIANCHKIDVMKKIMWFSYTDDMANILAIPVEKVKNIIYENKKGILPDKLEDFAQKKEKKIEFEHFEEDLSRYADE
ncbi:MAG: regulatory iron-sulfur-containing complex subunit RicT [Bacteroidales bacterium]|jgi:cell fate regulator YaaT (PSP1 superfamily)|nr:hypothetical protein [Bacteroidales bacterium]